MLSLIWWLAITVFLSASAIYEDQIGKFDWRQKYVGCPRQMHMERPKGAKPPHIFVSTEADMIASLKASTGQIAWRQQLEHSSAVPLSFSSAAKLLITVTKDGEVVRAWDRETGILAWETQIPRITTSWEKSQALVSDGNVFIFRDSHVTALSLNSGQLKWTTKAENIRNWLGSVPGSQALTVVGGVEGAELIIVRIDATNGAIAKTQKLPSSWFRREKCNLSDTLLWCFDDSGFYVADLSSDPVTVHHTPLQSVVEISNLNMREVLVVNTLTNTYIYRISLSEPPALLLTLVKAEAVSAYVTPDGHNFLAVVKPTNSIVVYDAVNGEQLFVGTIPGKDLAPAKLISFIGTSKEFEFAIVLEDCRFIYLVGSSNKLAMEWIRHEALSTITSVEMVDLPLSEAQADIESEFAADGGSIVESLIRRLRSQAEQFRRACIGAANQIFSSSNFLPFHSKSFADWMASLRLASRSARRKDAPYERDYFNLRKIIVASTLKSIVYGIDSSDGTILWHLYLGKNIKPLRGSLGNEKIPLYVQRTTAHYHFSPQATVVAADKNSGHAALISFNPITGTLLERKSLSTSITRVEILPFPNAQTHLHHLVMLDANNKVILYPENMDGLEQLVPVHFFNFNAAGDLEGFALNVSRKQLSPTWKVRLDFASEQKIVAVVPKPSYQKVHSAGRVLGNRSVLYKYANPNLVAIALLDSTHSILQIYLIDAVSGYIVYNAKQNKIAGPIHLIHCENWLAYSYWNEKGRRTEIAVVELYEGLEQTDALHYNSLAPTVTSNIAAVSQAYIFPQGVTALGVTETEQGLSTRSLLVAMPFGGIYGISKRLLDGRRPLEMTQELAEEMLLPYRPELPVAFEDFINYNQSVHGIRGFKTSPSGLESTSLMLAYGTDLFFTQLNPSGTFDILKDDFDHLLISVVLIGLVVGSLVCKKLGKNNSLKQAWQ